MDDTLPQPTPPTNNDTPSINILPEPERRTLLEKWRNYTSGLSSPDNFINFGFFFMIGACLQRRVWTGAEHLPLYSNSFIILTGRPGVGKGLVIKEVNKVMRHHPFDDKDKHAFFGATPKKAEELKYNVASDILKHKSSNAKEDEKESKTLFPIGAETTTFEALMLKMGKSRRRINYYDKDGKPQIYTHSSVTFMLEELSSMFKKHKEDVGKFLLNAYDCGDYEYDTKNKGTDSLTRICVSILAGTTPDFLEESYSNRTMEQGLSSRMWFIYEPSNRKNVLAPPPLTEDQKQDFQDILAHVKLLSKLYGYAKFSDEAWSYMVKWWDEENVNRANYNPKLEHYYARKNIHVMKLAMAIHFADSLEMEIQLSSVKEAMRNLEIVERNMHHALSFGKDNPLAKKSQKVLEVLKIQNRSMTGTEILLEVWDCCTEGELRDILSALIGFQKIQLVNGNGETQYQLAVRKDNK